MVWKSEFLCASSLFHLCDAAKDFRRKQLLQEGFHKYLCDTYCCIIPELSTHFDLKNLREVSKMMFVRRPLWLVAALFLCLVPTIMGSGHHDWQHLREQPRQLNDGNTANIEEANTTATDNDDHVILYNDLSAVLESGCSKVLSSLLTCVGSFCGSDTCSAVSEETSSNRRGKAQDINNFVS
jgi:hypothetical protein